MRNAPLLDGALAKTAGQASSQSVPHTTDNDHEARCERCNRPLRAELAVRAGIGATCALLALGGDRR